VDNSWLVVVVRDFSVVKPGHVVVEAGFSWLRVVFIGKKWRVEAEIGYLWFSRGYLWRNVENSIAWWPKVELLPYPSANLGFPAGFYRRFLHYE